ncbi:MAG TPA: type IV pilin protein [Steroidobacteraceae bacterium]|nr:type IV pilin protein [Steroidobacteraceae bacterium]
MRRKNSGITLMELMVVMAIVGILAGIAIPSYRAYIERANRTDAKAALLSMAGALERCFTRFNSYAEDDGCEVEFPAASTEGYYQITAPTLSAVAFTLRATPQDGQANDTQCGSFTLDNANSKGVILEGDTPGSTAIARKCWGK